MRGPAERSAQVDVREQRRPAMSRLPSRAEACRIPASREHLHVLAPGSWQWGDEAGRPRQWVGNHGLTEQGALLSPRHPAWAGAAWPGPLQRHAHRFRRISTQTSVQLAPYLIITCTSSSPASSN